MSSGSGNLRVDQFFRSRKAKCLSPSRGISKTVKEVKSPNTKGSLDGYLVKSADVCSSQLVQSNLNNRDTGEQQPNNKDKGPTISSNGLQLEDTCKSQSCSSHPQLSPGKETETLNFGDHRKTLDQFADSFLAICCSGIASNDTTSLKEHEVNGSLKRNRRAESPDNNLINKSRLKKKQCAIGGNNLLGRLTESINAPDETTQGRDQNTDTCCSSSSKLEYLQSGKLPSNDDGADVNDGNLPEQQSITYKDLLIFKNEELDLKPHQESINNLRVGSESKLSNPPSFETPMLKKCSRIFGNQIDQNSIFTPKSDSVKRSACKDPKWVYRSSLSPGDDFWNEAIQVVDGLAAIKDGNILEHGYQCEQCEIVQYQQRQLQSHMTTGEINTNFSTRERPGCNEMEAHTLIVQHEGFSLPVKHFDFECEDCTMTNDASAVTTTKFLEGENENSEVKTEEVGEGDKVLAHIGATNISEVSSSKVHDSSNSKNEIGTPSVFLLKDNLELSNWLPERICDEYTKKGVTKLYPWQVECLQLDGVLEWKNLVYCASTSAGKSLVAEVLLLRRVLSAQKKALLVLPFVSLCAEKAEHLEKLLDPFNKRVRSFYGSQGGGTLPNDTSVAVCTIEKANSLVNRLLEEGRLGEVGIMVIDELHMVGDLSRGYLLELMLTKLRYATGEGAPNASLNDSPESNRDRSRMNHGMQIVGMSATMPNVAAVADWLQAAFYETEFRPVPLDEYIKVGNLIHNKTLEVVRTIRKGANLGGKDPDHVVELCYEVVQGGHSVLVFCSSRKACEITAKHIAKFIKDLMYQTRDNDLSYNDALSAVDELRKSPSGLDPTLAETLPVGVAYHHAGLTVEEREIIEACYRKGIVRVLTATSTLAAGVNLPARRVIFRQPKIGRDFIDGTRYRQMSGRAGRAGIDTKGESIIICKPEEVKRITALLNESCPPLKSCLAEDKNGMKRAILEVVAGGIVQTASDVHRYVKCTLLNSTQPFEDVVKSAQDSLYWLCHAKFVEWDEQTQMYFATPLGRAAFGSSLSPEESMVVFEDLARAREGFVLASDLHLLYEVTPINIEFEPDWELFYQRFMELSPLDQAVGNRVGVTEPFLMRMAHGAPVMQPHGKPRNRKSPLNKNVQSLLSLHGNNGLPMDQALRVCRRFYVALILARLVEEVPLNDVCEAFKVPRGMIQALQENAGRFASMVVAFCERLGWNDLEGLFSKFQNRVSFGVRAEIAELTSIPFVKGARARALYKAGLRTPQAVAEASLKELFEALFHSSSWAAQDGSRSETQFRIQMGVAKKIKNGARKIVLDQAEEARMAAFTAFRALGVNVPVALSQPVNNIANESYDDVGENAVLSKENGSENNLVGQKTTSSSGLEMTVLANTSISHAKSTSKAEPGALTVQDQTRIQNVPETDKETTNTSVNKCAMNSSSLDAQRERGNHVINAASHGNTLTFDKKWAQNSAVGTPIFSGSNINPEANHVSSKVNETDRVVTFNEGPVDVDNLSGGFDCFIDAWDKIPEFFFDLHYNIVTEKSSSYFEVHGLAVCWENSPVYYLKIAKCLSEENSVSACNDTIVASSCTKSVEDIARERWSRITHLMNRKGSRKVTWHLKSQLQAFQKPIISQPTEILQNKIKNCRSMSSSSDGNGRSVSLPSIDIEEPIDACIIAWMLWPDEESTYGSTLEQEVRKRLPGEIAAAANRSGRWLNQMGRVAQNGCCRRVAQIRALYFVLWKLIIAEGLQDVLLSVEMPLVRVLVDMEKWGIGLNMEACWQARQVLEKKLKELEDKAHMLAGVTFSLAMPADVANVLYGILQLPVPQGCKKGKQHPSTDKHALELLRHHHPIVMVIKEHRTLSNLLQCTVISVLSRARLSDGMQVHCVHGRWLQTSTATGRLSMEEPNLQRVEHSVDFTMKAEHGRPLDDVKLSEYQINAREIFIPTQKNWLLVSADYSQIELRLMAHFSEDESLISFLQKPDGDVFIMIAAKWTGQNESDITDKQREQTKKLVYGMLYGMGVNTLADNLECTVSEANEKYERFKCAFPGVSSWLQQAVANCRQKGHIRTLSGRKRYLEKINFGSRLEQARAERQAVNSICQGSAADIIKKAMLNVHSVILGKCLEELDCSMFSGLKGNCHLLLQIHDELVLEVEPTMLKEAATLVRSCMENAVTLKVPLKVKIRVGGTWGSLQPYKDPE